LTPTCLSDIFHSMSDPEIHRRESSAIGGLGEALEKGGLKPRPGSWLEGVLIDTKFENPASEIFSEWLSGIVDNPSRRVTEEHLERLKEMLRPHLTEFQQARITHDFLANILAKAEKTEKGMAAGTDT